MTMSIFCGKLDEIPQISIDRFVGERNIEESTAYFLSHYHSDHLNGLKTAEFQKALLERDHVYLYTSAITKCFLKNSRYRNLLPKVRVLPNVGPKILSIPFLNASKPPIDIQVTMIPAAHCPGSVMFFFELEQGNVLYTGDFRLSLEDICSISDFHHKDGTPKEISTMYLDATFFDDLYPWFPTREDCSHRVCHLIKEWLEKSPYHEVFFLTSAFCGAEFIFCEIKNKLGMKVHMSPEKIKIFEAVKEISEAITDDRCETRIHACVFKGKIPWRCKRPAHLVKKIRLSCMWYEKNCAVKGDIKDEISEYTRVCYACHCSRKEIIDFVEYFLPEKVVACAIPKDKTVAEVEVELKNLIIASRKERRSRSYSDSSDHHKSNSSKCQIGRKMMSSPRKKRHFVPVSEGMSDDESMPKYSSCSNKEQAMTLGKEKPVEEFSVTSEVKEPEFGMERGNNDLSMENKTSESFPEHSNTQDEESSALNSQESTPSDLVPTSEFSSRKSVSREGETDSEKATTSKTPQVSLVVTGSSNESDLDPSPSLLPQFDKKVVDPTESHRRRSPDLYIVGNYQDETEVEVITLSSDESPEISVMD